MAILNTTLQAAGGAAKGGLKGFGWAAGLSALAGVAVAAGAAALLGPALILPMMGLGAAAVGGGLVGSVGGLRGMALGATLGIAAAAIGIVATGGLGAIVPLMAGAATLVASAAAAIGVGRFLAPAFSFFGGIMGLGKGAKNAQQQQHEETMDVKRAQLAELTAQNQTRSDYINGVAAGGNAALSMSQDVVDANIAAMERQNMMAQQNAGRIAYGPHSAKVLQQEQQQQQGVRAPSFIP